MYQVFYRMKFYNEKCYINILQIIYLKLNLFFFSFWPIEFGIIVCALISWDSQPLTKTLVDQFYSVVPKYRIYFLTKNVTKVLRYRHGIQYSPYVLIIHCYKRVLLNIKSFIASDATRHFRPLWIITHQSPECNIIFLPL